MALTETEKRQEKKEKPLTKIVVRRLPPTMTKEQFLEQVSPLPEYNYFYHVKGDSSMGENAFSRAYFNFLSVDDVYAFKEKFDTYVFVDGKGHEYPAVVEYAPFQKVPKKRGGKARPDPKCNTIETDPYYVDFVANLNKPVEQNEKPEYSLQLGERSEDKNKVVSTPLLEFVKNRQAQKLKIREVRRQERERRKQEYERKKEHGKYYEERSQPKGFGKKSQAKPPKEPPASTDKTEEASQNKDKSSSENKPYREKKEKKEIKPRFPKKEHHSDPYHSNEYKPQKHHDHSKREDAGKVNTKKVKKYSERREERKLEAQKRLEQQTGKPDATEMDKSKEHAPKPKEVIDNLEDNKEDLSNDKNEQGSSRRIRNKDRPTIPLYRPGMLSKRKHTEPENGCVKTDQNTENSLKDDQTSEVKED